MTAAQERLAREKVENEERRAADAARQAQLKRSEELQDKTVIEVAVPSIKADSQPMPANNPLSTGSVQTVSVTTDREQTLYRSAVTAYKIGDCTESIKPSTPSLKHTPIPLSPAMPPIIAMIARIDNRRL